MPQRHPGYVIVLKISQFIFGNYYATAIVIIQAFVLFGAIHFFYNTINRLIKLNVLQNALLIAVLIFPIFPPLSIANNICPESLSYTLYLIYVALISDYIISKHAPKIIIIASVFTALTLIRGQFIISALPLLLVFLIQFKRHKKFKTYLKQSIIFLCFPILVTLIDSSYHKIKDNHFKTTPYGFVNASSLAFFVSKDIDSIKFKSLNEKHVFAQVYDSLKANKLLNNKLDLSFQDNYNNFLLNIGKICNQYIHSINIEYYMTISKKKTTEEQFEDAIFKSEKNCKALTLNLIRLNFYNWISFFFKNLSHAFYSVFFLIGIIILFVYSLIKSLKSNNKHLNLLVLFLTLTISNALLISFASHTIMRYLFYNYVLILLSLILLNKVYKNG